MISREQIEKAILRNMDEGTAATKAINYAVGKLETQYQLGVYHTQLWIGFTKQEALKMALSFTHSPVDYKRVNLTDYTGGQV